MTGNHEIDVYDLRGIERRLAEDRSTAELGIRLARIGDRIFVRGQVAAEEGRERVLAVVRESCPQCEVVDELGCAERDLSTEPGSAEEIR